MPLNNPITESQIPASIARDTEVAVAVLAHVATVDPHLQYPTQARGDGRYIRNEQGLILGIKKFTGTTNSTTGNANFPHGLLASKILTTSCIINGFPPTYLAANFGGSAEYNFFFTYTDFYIVCGINKTNLTGQPYKVMIIYEA